MSFLFTLLVALGKLLAFVVGGAVLAVAVICLLGIAVAAASYVFDRRG